jgi:histone H3/H4
MDETWSRCSSCKSEIAYQTTYWVCSVSTCTRKRTGMVFCTVGCWEMHLPMMRHREAFAVEERSPSRQQHLAELAAESTSHPPSSGGSSATPPVAARHSDANAAAVRRRVGGDEPFGHADTDEVLVVVSKLKKYVRDRSGMNTSDGVVEALSDHLRTLCDEAIRGAGRDGRRTVMERDFIMLTRVTERRG